MGSREAFVLAATRHADVAAQRRLGEKQSTVKRRRGIKQRPRHECREQIHPWTLLALGQILQQSFEVGLIAEEEQRIAATFLDAFGNRLDIHLTAGITHRQQLLVAAPDLRLNGYKLKVAARKAHRFLIGLLENDRCSFDELLPWIRRHALKL
jgi:hypothetical protein